MKIPLSRLEEVRRDPIAFRESGGAGVPYSRISAYRVWQLATRKIHQPSGGLETAVDYLEDHFRRNFKASKRNDERLNDLTEKLLAYDRDFDRLGQHVVELGKRVRIRLDSDSFLTGEVPRLDLVSSGGYAVYLFEKESQGWQHELRMPILQRCFANELQCPSAQVSVGIYCFNDDRHYSHVYSTSQIGEAWNEALSLAISLR
jgi:hypothetical protein